MGHDARRPSRAGQQSREQTGPRTRAASLVASSWNPETRTIDVVWSTGADVERADLWTGARWIERLSMDPAHVRLGRLNSGASFLRAHEQGDLNAVMGVIVDGSARIENGRGVATVRLSDRDDVRGLVGDIAGGIIRNVSVGYLVHSETKSKGDGGGEIRTAVDWEPMEVSAVPIPADAGAQVRGNMARKGKTDSARMVDPAMAQEMADEAAALAAKASEIAAAAGEDKPTDEAMASEDKPADPAPEQEAARAQANAAAMVVAERERALAIRSAVGKLRLPAEAGDELIRSGADLATARAALIDKAAEAAKGTRIMGANRIELGASDADQRRAGLVNALQHRGNVRVGGKYVELTDAGRAHRGMRLADVARQTLAASGVECREWTDSRVFSTCLKRAQGTSDFANLLADVTNKSLLAAYQEFEPTYPQIAARGTVRNLQTRYPTILSGVADLTDVAEGADYPVKSLSDKRESYSVVKKGGILEITLEALLKDDLDGFTRLPQTLGLAARRAEELAVYKIINDNGNLADGVALFATATHANLAGAGDTGTPTAARLDATDKLLGAQTGLKAEKIDVRGEILLVPRQLRHTAQQLFDPRYVPTAATGVIAGELATFKVVWSNFLTSADAWYVFANPALSPVLEYAFLEGEEGITVEEEEGFVNDVHKFKVRHWFGAGAADFRGAAKNNGA